MTVRNENRYRNTAETDGVQIYYFIDEKIKDLRGDNIFSEVLVLQISAGQAL